MVLTVTEHTGSFRSPRLDHDCYTYYKIVEGGQKPANSAYPIVVVHGGPLLSHDYCLPLANLAESPRISSVIFYDEIGSGKSARIADDGRQTFSKHFWDINIAQLKTLLDDLNLTTTGFYLAGHSLGSMLAATYAATYPSGLKALILMNALTNVTDLTKANQQLFKDFPPEVGDAIIEFEEHARGERSKNTVSIDSYIAAAGTFRSKHFSRTAQPSESTMQSFMYAQEVMDVFEAVCGGRTMFLWGEPIAKHNTQPMLHKIACPTLILKGEFDQCLDFCQRPFLELIPQTQVVEFGDTTHTFTNAVVDATIEGASHMMMDEAPERVEAEVASFIQKLWDQAAAGNDAGKG